MISKEEILKLAELARLDIKDEEVEPLQKDISKILEYVGRLGEANQGDTSLASREESPLRRSTDIVLPPVLCNVMREDAPRAAGDPLADKREKLRAAFPKQEKGYNVVRKIIQKDESR